MSIKRAFPKEIMVKWEDAGSDEPFMSVGVDPNEMSEGAGEQTEIGIYRLVRRAKIVCNAEIVRK
jgi:hypothetical protein